MRYLENRTLLPPIGMMRGKHSLESMLFPQGKKNMIYELLYLICY